MSVKLKPVAEQGTMTLGDAWKENKDVINMLVGGSAFGLAFMGYRQFPEVTNRIKDVASQAIESVQTFLYSNAPSFEELKERLQTPAGQNIVATVVLFGISGFLFYKNCQKLNVPNPLEAEFSTVSKKDDGLTQAQPQINTTDSQTQQMVDELSTSFKGLSSNTVDKELNTEMLILNRSFLDYLRDGTPRGTDDNNIYTKDDSDRGLDISEYSQKSLSKSASSESIDREHSLSLRQTTSNVEALTESLARVSTSSEEKSASSKDSVNSNDSKYTDPDGFKRTAKEIAREQQRAHKRRQKERKLSKSA